MYSYINQRGSKTLFNDSPPSRFRCFECVGFTGVATFPVLKLDLMLTPSWLCRDSP